MGNIKNEFLNSGFYGPFNLLSNKECKERTFEFSKIQQNCPLDWNKGYAATNRSYYNIAKDSRIVSLLTIILGEDIMLWGAKLIQISSLETKHWMAVPEICSTHYNPQAVSIIISFEYTEVKVDSTHINKIPGIGIYKLMQTENILQTPMLSRKRLTDLTSLKIREKDVRKIILFKGDACIVAGNLFYKIRFENNNKLSTALLLQYANPDTPIRIPIFDSRYNVLNFELLPLPPCILIKGNGRKTQNRIIPPPPATGTQKPCLTTLVRQLSFPLSGNIETGLQSYRIFHGSTNNLKYFGCYVSVLEPGSQPHEPHSHEDEELLVVLCGSADIIFSKNSKDGPLKRERIQKGQCVYYSSFHNHTIYNPGTAPVTYLIFKWNSNNIHKVETLRTKVFSLKSNCITESVRNLTKFTVFEGNTKFLSKLQAHVSIMNPGYFYQPHSDSYDIAILVLQGEIKTLDHQVNSNGIILHGAGEAHGINNIGASPAKYLVFEFH